MSELIDNTVKLVEGFNDDIKSDLSSKNIDNRGIASNSLRIETTKNSVKSIGVFYLTFLDKGRGPGKFPPPEVIAGWAATKPVEINPYLIGRKIAREGTEIFKNPSKGILLDQKRDKLAKAINENAPKWVKDDLLILIKAGNKKIK